MAFHVCVDSIFTLSQDNFSNLQSIPEVGLWRFLPQGEKVLIFSEVGNNLCPPSPPHREKLRNKIVFKTPKKHPQKALTKSSHKKHPQKVQRKENVDAGLTHDVEGGGAAGRGSFWVDCLALVVPPRVPTHLRENRFKSIALTKQTITFCRTNDCVLITMPAPWSWVNSLPWNANLLVRLLSFFKVHIPSLRLRGRLWEDGRESGAKSLCGGP